MTEEYIYDSDSSHWSDFRHGIGDLRDGAGLWRIWVTLGWRDFLHQTQRTFLGPLWSIVGTGITVGALGYVYGALLKTDSVDGYPFIAAGLILWFFIAGCVNGGFSVFLSGAGVIKERSLPVSFTVFRYAFRLFVELGYKFLVFVIIAVAMQLPWHWEILLVVPGLLLFVLNGLWVLLLFGVIGARLRDAQELVSPLMLIAFLSTPVLWPQSMLGSNTLIATLNPFTHILAIMRDPLLGQMAPMLSVKIVLAITIVGWILAIVVFARAKNRIVFWI